ncbi:ankyrin repeat-containing domain protein [Neocallimastix lanati (nom. inval.)]|nr:ankyrin repeat-containing domain protein [Neocallimastix sp. JGI-2020a]
MIYQKDNNKLIFSTNNTNKRDIVLEAYNKNRLKINKSEVIIKLNINDLYISSSLIKKLINDNKFEVLDIIFNNLKFYDNEFIKWLFYQYKRLISTISYLNNTIENKNKHLTQYLIEHVIDFNKTDEFGRSPLFDVCYTGNKEIVEYLVEHGAIINRENEDGDITIFKACQSGNKELVVYLVEHGVDINKEENRYGETPLFSACRSRHKKIIEYLEEHEADINKMHRKIWS